MAELRESFPTLEGATQEGQALRAVQEGQSVAAKNGSLGFAFKDASGNAIAPQLTSDGKLPVTSESAGNGKFARGTNAGSATDVDVATLTLTASKVYENMRLLVSCFRDATFQLVQVDDATETILADVRVGPGHPSESIDLGELEITAGATGTQELVVRAKNENALSNLTATISCRENT